MTILINTIYIMILYIISYMDIKKGIVDNKIVLIQIILSIVKIIAYDMPMNIYGGLLAVPFLIASMISISAFGGGDIKIIFALSLYLGFEKSVTALLISMVAILIYQYLYKKVMDKKINSIPMCPFLAVGYGIMSIL